ncbi:uncharacterized protein [Haliotis cracherodii]|uniref:uncharacterized protein n=1 Tax=Haliotis cracherodii TaxID=6455 RepID=UPI0039EB92B1
MFTSPGGHYATAILYTTPRSRLQISSCENVAFNKTATSTSGALNNWTSDKAVDGNRDQDVHGGSCFHSINYPSMWRVDLGRQYRIRHVTVYHREMEDGHNFLDRIANCTVHLSNDTSTNGTLCYTFPATVSNSVIDLVCDGSGRYLTIRNPGRATGEGNTLNICEVEIYACSRGTYGESCEDFCHCHSSSCEPNNGTCPGDCRPGWQGDRCDTECSNRTYGDACADKCQERNCQGTSPCHHVTGKCEPGCKAGWTGEDCRSECDDGNYGVDCKEPCAGRECADINSSCDRYNGSCDTGCLVGWTGDDCTQVQETLPVSTIVGCATVAVILLFFVIITILLVRRKRKQSAASVPERVVGHRENCKSTKSEIHGLTKQFQYRFMHMSFG